MAPLQPSPADEPLSLTVRSAREAALRVLEKHRVTGMWVGDLLDQLFRESALPASERGLATELACGVVRRQGTLDAILKTLVARPADQVEVSLWTILRLGVYQIVMLDGIPSHAAVHETVELCKRAGRMRWSGFVNGVLRGATRLATDQFQTTPSASAVPVSVDRHRILNKPVFFEPESDLPAYLAGAFSLPLWLTERWVKRFKPEELFRMGAWFNSPSPLMARPNTLRSSYDEVVADFQAAGITIQPLEGTESFVIEGTTRVEALPGFVEGKFVIQDFSASRAAVRLAPQPGQRVWDVCAAPGGKTCHLAALMKNEGHILATDIRSDRLEIVHENAQRLGATIIRSQLVDEQGFRLPTGPFDAILVDVPCSNTGVLAKRPEARWRITPDGVRELNRVQANLLGWSLERLTSGGRLVYSTCSIEPDENENLVRRVLESFPNAKLVEEQTFLPGQPADGAYQALIVTNP
ncbi:16S rRNA (cytosine(967)-C(5))-methyltransferase RsmB [Schlesneria paludicola]|uniref:16S rRNA (cytosine(967)-C(5))-methyltransferase RsmB n=1 Tax=Schlesneria paludicola TaxID=360056 RepID=UPI000306FB30|nr:16S rRNA (cytosine(967)-C(5))-methyltransferase RsmB [Schlesneria paludicola]